MLATMSMVEFVFVTCYQDTLVRPVAPRVSVGEGVELCFEFLKETDISKSTLTTTPIFTS